jgi:GxxExxY protein
LPQKSAKGARSSGVKDPIFQLCDQVRETSFALHRHLRHGHVEKVYENGLYHRLRKQGIAVLQQHPLSVFDEDGTLLGEFSADLFVNQELIVELKACRARADDHVAQLLGYLRASRIEHGLLINFGSARIEIRKYVLADTA